MIFLTGVLLFILFNSTIATDYCRKGLCSNGRKHVGCGNTGGWGSICGKNPSLHVITEEFKQFILHLHNKNRQDIACGSIPRYASAANMTEMRWNDELAKIACFNAKSCVFAHDSCRNTDDHSYAGQNLAIIGQTKGYKDVREAYEYLHGEWFNEHADCDMHAIRKYESRSGPQIGHFTQIVSDKANEVGCCISKFETKNMKYVYIVCNYSYTNILDQPIYVEGKPKCRKYSKKYRSLCVS